MGDGLTGMETEPVRLLVKLEVDFAALRFFALPRAVASFGRSTVENAGQVKLQKWRN
jgi:hypothetical protein